jgi:BirA family biotin operon repressor/biotin-[acetyl-CoA-carboxylase] ligase
MLYPIIRPQFTGLSIVVGLAVMNALKLAGLSADFMLKWPNDVVFDGKKVGGILVDTFNAPVPYAIISLGMNANAIHTKTDEVTQPWVSLREIFDRQVDRSKLVVHLINSIFEYAGKLEQRGFDSFKAEWEAYDVLFGKQLIVRDVKSDESCEGVGCGVDANGNLQIKTDEGTKTVFSSEVTVRRH